MNDRLLRSALRANAVFSALSGLGFLLFATSLSDAAGIGDPRVLQGLGPGLLAFAAALVWLSFRDVVSPAAARTVVGMDLAWVVGTVPVVLLDVLSHTGAIAAVIVADVVLVLALLQTAGIRRLRVGARPCGADTPLAALRDV